MGSLDPVPDSSLWGGLKEAAVERMKQVGCLSLRECVEVIVPLTLGDPVEFQRPVSGDRSLNPSSPDITSNGTFLQFSCHLLRQVLPDYSKITVLTPPAQNFSSP